MIKERIRRTKTNSTNSVDTKQYIDVQLKQHTKVMPFLNISNTIDQREQFETERESCTKYRLILTIKPYCTNILFNTVTEIVKNEGTKDPNLLKIANAKAITLDTKELGDDYEIKGKTSVTNVDMVRNSEYSNGSNPFVYHCGFDIFNNHILRNQSFKLICTNPIQQNSYNTIEDYMRYEDGSSVKLSRRTDIDKIVTGENRHLYMKDDILSFINSINTNLSEENGWYGFNNRSTIPSCEKKEIKKGTYEWKDLKVSKVFNGKNMNTIEENDRMCCEFIEMYPDSSLYSFSPKYNKFQNREEQNWDICITYPYENDSSKDRILINGTTEDGTICNALLLAEVKCTKGTSTQDVVLFRSYVKHNLTVGDSFKLYYNKKNQEGSGIFVEFEDKEFVVTNIGNLSDEYQDYYFYINDYQDIVEVTGEDLNLYNFRFVKVVNGRECKYYYRKFRKLPNFRIKTKELTDEIAQNREKINGETNTDFNEEIESFENYLKENCTVKHEGKEALLFNKEQYPLAFSKTIYGDKNAQITYTDTIEIDKLTDNLGRPLTELYVTFIKRNKGHNLWYKASKTVEDMENIEFSHCFGEVISGLDIHGEKGDSEEIKKNREEVGDGSVLYNEIKDKALDTDIDVDKTDIFYGDVVELNPHTMKETTLSEVYFRFNTEQREHNFSEDNTNELDCSTFIYDEIESDDYDRYGFNCAHYDVKDINEKDPIRRIEGYYYKAHYPIQVREFGALRQASHKQLKVVWCRPRQSNGLYIDVVSSLPSGATDNGTVYLCDNSTGEILNKLKVYSVLSSIRLLLNPLKKTDKNYKSIYEIVEGLLYSVRDVKEGDTWVDEDGNKHTAGKDETVEDYSTPKYILRTKNEDIPNYAYHVGNNVYIWRDVLNVGSNDAVSLTEYPFANDHFYINKDINFFLKRQDPFGENGLYAEILTPNDIYGNGKTTNIYEYNDSSNVVC